MTFNRRITRSVWLCATLAFAACLDVNSPTQGGPSVFLAVPDGWTTNYDTFAGIGLSKIDAHTGAVAAYLSGQGTGPVQAVLQQSIVADQFLGKRVRYSGWLKPKNVIGTSSGLWMRVDGAESTVAFDNMDSRIVGGAGDWRQVSIVLDVPANAVGISFGALFVAQGTLIVDDLTFEIVPTTVPVTDLLTAPAPGDASTIAALYSGAAAAPFNLGFEGVPEINDATIAWLTSNSATLSTTDPAAPLTDLAPFAEMVGTAHVVGLGEGTHGTTEFQRAKHRLFRYLVEQQGFTHLAIEGSAPDAAAVNNYVLTGQGDPTKLLSGLRFWISNTQEVLDLIKWMREWNTTAPANRRVQFSGFDFQQPGGAMDSVEAFIARVDPARTGYVRARYTCFDPFRSEGATFGAPMQIYNARLATSRADCADDAREVHDLITGNAGLYEAASSEDTYANALHSARLVQQWESMATNFTLTNLSRSSVSRDSSMAENVQWIRERAGPGAKVALWAHNDHIVRQGNTMGRHISTAYGTDYVAMAFAFDFGVLNAVNGSTGALEPVRPADVPASWFEATLRKTNKDIMLLDTRRFASGGAATAPFGGPITMRSVGSTFNTSSPYGFPRRYQLPADFDLLYFVKSTHETKLLPFVF